MARNFRQPGETIPVTAPADVASGDVVVVGSLVGVAHTTALQGETVEIGLCGVWDLPKATPLEMNPGDALWVDAGTGKLTKTAAGNTLAGVCVAHAGSAEATVAIRLGGADPTALAAAITALTARVAALEA